MRWIKVPNGPEGLVFWAILGLIALLLIGHGYRSLMGFSASEYTNRMILLACEEILAVFDIIKIDPSKELVFRERRVLIERFGCRLVRLDHASLAKRFFALPFDIHMDGRSYGRWLLIPPSKNSGMALLPDGRNRTKGPV